MKYVLFFLLALAPTLFAQETFPSNGVRDERPELYAITNVTLVAGPGTVVPNATLVVRKGIVEAAGSSVSIPAAAVRYDMGGRWIYPAFIDLDSDYGLPETKQKKSSGNEEDDEDEGGPQLETKKKGVHGWNQALNPEVDTYTLFTVNSDKAAELRALGFGAVLTHRHDGIARGTSAFVLLGNQRENELLVRDRAAAHYSFDKGSSTQDYPGSLMGSIALLRQTYLDAAWYRTAGRREYNLTLEAWNARQSLPQIFEVDNKLSALRADKVGDEFGVQYIIRGSGDEYQRITEIKATGARFIIPVNFPAPFDVEDPFDARNISLATLKHWELAPSNPAMLERAGITFALTSALLKDKKEFLAHVRLAVQRGLSKRTALDALTRQPAAMIGLADRIGTLEPGRIANFIVASGDIFDVGTVVYENWVNGRRYRTTAGALADLRGEYNLTIDETERMTLVLSGPPESVGARIIRGKDSLAVAISRTDNAITLRFSPDTSAPSGSVRLSGWIAGTVWSGRGQHTNGRWVSWTARQTAPYSEKTRQDSAARPETPGVLTYPNTEYGWEKLPVQEKVLLRNATVWTCEADGILPQTDVLIDKGKIAAVGTNISAGGAVVVDATGKHITPGIIDEHSHIAISRGVNEWTQAITSEVRIGDVLNSDDVNIYRQLAGGVTTSHLLHGSANPIGGQSQLIKLRWGLAPEALKFEGADGFIKFALGENVKQSNWGEKNVVRFPQTRMGVEQVFIDGFTRAKEYEQAVRRGESPRRDLELDALVEILNSKRFITCHSYVQSEITMLMRVAEQFGFKVNTFTHILEGYKVADKMKAHGAGASSFSDWWAYKYEVIDAIPYNGAILHNMGVVTAYNSDDPEMARRLNQEAAKAVKYGGVPEEEALKFVTLNPAKLLHIDNRTGSIKAGKDADIVLWNEHPLSVYAVAEQTYVDGIRYYDRATDLVKREEIARERERLLRKMAEAKRGGAKTQKPTKHEEHHYHCDDLGDE